MQENRYNTCDRFLGGLEKDFIITEQIEDSPLTSEPSFLDYGIIADVIEVVRSFICLKISMYGIRMN